MEYTLKAGALYLHDRMLARIKNCFSGPEKRIVSADGDLLLQTEIRAGQDPRRAPGDVRQRRYSLVDAAGKEIAQAQRTTPRATSPRPWAGRCAGRPGWTTPRCGWRATMSLSCRTVRIISSSSPPARRWSGSCTGASTAAGISKRRRPSLRRSSAESCVLPVYRTGKRVLGCLNENGTRARRCKAARPGILSIRPGNASGIGGLFGRPYRPPLRCAFGLVRRAGCPHPAKPGPPSTQPAAGPLVGAASSRPCRTSGTTMARNHRDPVMAAYGHAALRRSTRARRESRACPADI